MKNMKQVSLFCPFITFDFFSNSSPLSPVLESESICGGDEDEDKKDVSDLVHLKLHFNAGFRLELGTRLNANRDRDASPSDRAQGRANVTPTNFDCDVYPAHPRSPPPTPA